MSKMGRYVFQLQEEIEQYEYRNRKGCAHAGEDEATRSAVQRHGNRRFFFGAGGDGESEAGASSEATSDPIPEASSAEEIQCRTGR